MKKINVYVILLLFITISSCSTAPVQESPRNLASETIAPIVAGPLPLLQTLPKISSDKGELVLELKKAIKNRTKGKTDAELTAAAEKFSQYLFFLGLGANDLKKAEKIQAEEAVVETEDKKVAGVKAQEDKEVAEEGEEEDKTPSNLRAILRLFIASTQFLDCPSMVDWECLEKDPTFKPTSDFRVAKNGSDLTTVVPAGKKLDMDVYFTEGWDGSKRAGLADRFAEKINRDAQKSLSLAMYGIDDINESMASVYQAIIKKAQSKETNVRAVVDVMGIERSKDGPWVFSYTDRPQMADKSVFGASHNPENPDGMRLTFQYSGTPSFLRELNGGITSESESRARIEWSTAKIMHNKFAVLENSKGDKAVWTGTANISKNCMGVEANANMAVYIRNNKIAEAFNDQFNLMFNFDKTLPIKSKLVTALDPQEDISSVGRFHRAKYPVSKRFFSFDDGTKVRVHFAPTDDAEHRAILPMLLSAQKGDEIRISMFGGTGYEIIRAMQYAVAKGANIKIAFDRRLGHGLTSWIRDAALNVNMPNPYARKFENANVEPGKISVRVSTWKGKNHYKVGSLSRKLPNGKWRAEQIIIGSQNWSSSGNDGNDENLISIQNLKADVKAAVMFNQEFDKRLWPKSMEEKRKF